MTVSKYFVLALRTVVSGWNRTDSLCGSHWTCSIQEVAYSTGMPSDASSLYGECIGDISCSNSGRNVCDLDHFPTSSRPLAKCRCKTDIFHIVSDFLSSDLSPVKVLYSWVNGSVVKKASRNYLQSPHGK